MGCHYRSVVRDRWYERWTCGQRIFAASIGGDIIANTRGSEVVGKDSFVEGGDIMVFESTKLGIKSKGKVSNKPHCNNRAITEDATALKLHHSGCVVQVDGDAGRDATDGIPVVLKCRRMSWSIYILGTATSAATTPGTRLSFTIVLDLSGERHWDQCCNR